MKQKVTVLGASSNPDRYSNKALLLLNEKGHDVYPVNPGLDKIGDFSVYSSIDDINDEIDTLTIYVKPSILEKNVESIIKLAPKRVIFNPGTESEEISNQFEKSGIQTLKACTIVLLNTEQF